MVDKWLDYFTGRGRPTFERWLTRSGLYMDAMKKTLEQEGVPTDLVHLVFVESGFNPQARSYASAVGPWQFIRGTARSSAAPSIRGSTSARIRRPDGAAARYLKSVRAVHLCLALASYNAGERTVINAIERQGTKDLGAAPAAANARRPGSWPCSRSRASELLASAPSNSGSARVRRGDIPGRGPALPTIPAARTSTRSAA
jgi:membrane-bound lytic murein transglycosylase D